MEKNISHQRASWSTSEKTLPWISRGTWGIFYSENWGCWALSPPPWAVWSGPSTYEMHDELLCPSFGMLPWGVGAERNAPEHWGFSKSGAVRRYSSGKLTSEEKKQGNKVSWSWRWLHCARWYGVHEHPTGSVIPCSCFWHSTYKQSLAIGRASAKVQEGLKGFAASLQRGWFS